MAEKKISELNSASQVNNDDVTILSQGSAGSGFASVKATILAIANKIVSGINYTSALQTTDKTITGAINEVAQGGGGGSSTFAGLSDVDITNVQNGQIPKYNSTTQKWENGNESSGGHTIKDSSGTSLAQEPNLKFAGMYVHDDSANQTTVGEYYREMTTAQYNQLSAAEKQGAIRLTDNPYVCNINEVENADATNIPYDSNTSVKEKIDSIGGNMYSVVINATTDSNGNITSNLLANEYVYIGTTGSVSLFFIPLNALSDGKIRIRVLDATSMNPVTGTVINQRFYFWKIS